MLGIRTYKDFALDLWVGPRKDFFCDLLVSETEASSDDCSVVFALTNQQSFVEQYERMLQNKISLRHVAFELSEDKQNILGDFEKLMAWIKNLMDSAFFQSTERISFISSSLELHDSCQQELFQTF
jgi:hypothetical protein